MIISAADIHTYYKPSRCQRRVYLIQHPPESIGIAGAASYYAQSQEADYHVERYYYKRLEKPFDISKFPEDQQVQATLEAILRQEPVIYKPIFTSEWRYKRRKYTLSARPEFLVWGEKGYTMRHCRMAKKITRENHPDIYTLAQFHAWVFYRVLGYWPAYLEVGNSTGNVMDIELPQSGKIEHQIQKLMDLKHARKMPYYPISWTKCQNCLFRDYCWDLAKSINDIALIPNLEAHLLLALRDSGLSTVEELLAAHTPESLAGFVWEESYTQREVGYEKALHILRMAQTLQTRKPILTQQPHLPISPTWVMFDLEGVPARPGQPEKVYLWGMSLKGEQDQNMQLISQAVNRQADRDNWFAFLEQSQTVFETLGDLPFVHWGSFEPYCINMYLQRFGDRQGAALRIQRNLFDFFQVLKDSVIVPLPSYSLKVIEKYVGFERQDQDTGGYWSVVNYLKSVSTKNPTRRQEILDQLLAYNGSDLEAMWHVLVWFQNFLAETEQEESQADV